MILKHEITVLLAVVLRVSPHFDRHESTYFFFFAHLLSLTQCAQTSVLRFFENEALQPVKTSKPWLLQVGKGKLFSVFLNPDASLLYNILCASDR